MIEVVEHINGFYKIVASQKLEVGKKYEIMERGTLEQNKMFHKLINIFYKSGLYNWESKNYYEFRNEIKKIFGCGFEYFLYVDENGKIQKTNEPQDFGILKSWSKYTKAERVKTIDNLLREMINIFYQNGFHNKEFDEIIKDYSND